MIPIKKETSDRIIAWLEKQYPVAICSLEHGGDPWKLLVMSILSAQCTDSRVNTASEALFRKYPTPDDLGHAGVEEVEPYVRSCGLYHNKAAAIVEASRVLVEQYDGKVPEDFDELLKLPGVGRKIANLIRGDIFGLPAIVCDTHCIRLAGRLGYVELSERNPRRVEKALTAIIPSEKQNDFCHRLVMFGRDWCSAKNPKCDLCPLSDICAHYRRERLYKRGEEFEMKMAAESAAREAAGQEAEEIPIEDIQLDGPAVIL